MRERIRQLYLLPPANNASLCSGEAIDLIKTSFLVFFLANWYTKRKNAKKNERTKEICASTDMNESQNRKKLIRLIASDPMKFLPILYLGKEGRGYFRPPGAPLDVFSTADQKKFSTRTKKNRERRPKVKIMNNEKRIEKFAPKCQNPHKINRYRNTVEQPLGGKGD